MTALEPTEILTEVRLSVPEPGSGSAYEKVEHPASGFALVGACAVVQPDGSAAVALTGIAASAVALADGDLAARSASSTSSATSSRPAEYRRHLAGVVARRALERARARAAEDTR